MIGSAINQVYCPRCGALDRTRHLILFFDRLDIWRRMQSASILHIAPEEGIESRICKQYPANYIKGDKNPRDTDAAALDITALPYDDASFDLIICNHVLEHVTNDCAALDNLYRVLKPGGLAVLQTPYSSVLENTFEDPGVQTADLRRRFYGQEDHVRVYGRDLFQRIEAAGFSVRLIAHDDVLADKDAFYYGVNQRESLILAQKTALSVE